MIALIVFAIIFTVFAVVCLMTAKEYKSKLLLVMAVAIVITIVISFVTQSVAIYGALGVLGAIPYIKMIRDGK